jgi:hypothetical protein
MLRYLTMAALFAAVPPAHAAPDLTSISERSGFTATGRYDEVERLCGAFQQAWPRRVKCTSFGRSPEGRPLLALVASDHAAFTPQAARARGLPVTLVQGGIHAGEIDGKDAGFLALREVLEGKLARGALGKQVLLFVPVFNVDGHEQFRKWNRPNQRGPVEMGWRTTGQNYNLNRDYVKADTPEMQAMLALVNQWDPLAYVDLHVTNGAKFEHDVSVQVEPWASADEELRKVGRSFRDKVLADISARGAIPQPFYMSFKDTDDPMSGFVDSVSEPRFSTGYFPLRNRLAMLVETHSWKDYPTRVRITHDTVISVLEQVARHGGDWHKVALAADARAARLQGKPVALTYRTTETVRMIDFRGYHFTRTASDVSGALMTRYDETRPQTWRVPVRDEIVPDLQVAAPQGGYLVPSAHAAMVARRLALHGIQFRHLRDGLKGEFESFRADTATFGARSFENHQRVTLAGAWKREHRALGAGALFVPISQPKARLAMAMLEPQAPDSLASWGLFNNAFERKEYMEDYVAEDVAREMMAADPALAVEFRRKIDQDPAFARNPSARLEFFSRRHPAWDPALNLYPVMRSPVVH